MRPRMRATPVWLWLLALPACGAVRVENPVGDIRVRVERRDEVDVHWAVRGREPRRDDVRIGKENGNGDVVVRALPGDGAALDLDVALPYHAELIASTAKGSISFTGLVFQARLMTTGGSIRVAAPWVLTRLEVTLREQPGSFPAPRVCPAGGVRQGPVGVGFRPARHGAPGDMLRYSNFGSTPLPDRVGGHSDPARFTGKAPRPSQSGSGRDV